MGSLGLLGFRFSSIGFRSLGFRSVGFTKETTGGEFRVYRVSIRLL